MNTQEKLGVLIEDRRTPEEVESTLFFVVATDSFMSGWGNAPGRSYYALACCSEEEIDVVKENLSNRSEMKRVRVVRKGWRPKLGQGDHLSIAGRTAAFPHYTPGHFKAEGGRS